MIGLICVAAGALGVGLLWTRDFAASGTDWLSATSRSAASATPGDVLAVWRGVVVGVVAGIAGWISAWALFGGVIAPLVVAMVCTSAPISGALRRYRSQSSDTWQAWPRLLAEIRILVTHRGQSIPVALLSAGTHAPIAMRQAFSDAARTWSLSTDFEASLRILKTSLADPTADAVCETLLAAHQIGGVRIDARLRALAEAAQAEAAARADARARQAGARFARSFVAVVPAFMALIGLSIGRGRQAYASSSGQWLAALSALAVAGCWGWAGRIMAIPMRKRVFIQ